MRLKMHLSDLVGLLLGCWIGNGIGFLLGLLVRRDLLLVSGFQTLFAFMVYRRAEKGRES